VYKSSKEKQVAQFGLKYDMLERFCTHASTSWYLLTETVSHWRLVRTVHSDFVECAIHVECAFNHERDVHEE